MNKAQHTDPKKLPSLTPDIRLFGEVSSAMLSEFFRQQAEMPNGKPVVFELSSEGGDADIGRRIAQEIFMWRKQGREMYFLGKSYVYSAGVTIMSAFPASHRFVTADCELLIHERKMQKDIGLDGSLRECRASIQNALAEIDSGQRLEEAGFEALVKGSRLTVEELRSRVMERDWYLCATEAREHGLVADIV